MSTTFRKSGHSLTHTPSGSAVASGEVIGPLGTGSRFGVATTDIADGGTGALSTSGDHELAATTADVWADGDTLYWNTATSALTDVAGALKVIGLAVGAKASGATSAAVLLNSVPSR